MDQLSASYPLALYLAAGGVLALYLRFLYHRCSSSVSGSESFTRVFPLLTLATTAVIAVVKSSVALSLGLVGALSIVRFRAAIKDPEELVYLFLTIAVGLALGAQQLALALVLVATATVFIVGMHFLNGSRRQQNLMLTVTGDTEQYFGTKESLLLKAVEELLGEYSLQRLDINDGRSQVRLTMKPINPQSLATKIAALKERLPGCEFSYVNVSSVH